MPAKFIFLAAVGVVILVVGFLLFRLRGKRPAAINPVEATAQMLAKTAFANAQAVADQLQPAAKMQSLIDDAANKLGHRNRAEFVREQHALLYSAVRIADVWQAQAGGLKNSTDYGTVREACDSFKANLQEAHAAQQAIVNACDKVQRLNETIDADYGKIRNKVTEAERVIAEVPRHFRTESLSARVDDIRKHVRLAYDDMEQQNLLDAARAFAEAELALDGLIAEAQNLQQRRDNLVARLQHLREVIQQQNTQGVHHAKTSLLTLQERYTPDCFDEEKQRMHEATAWFRTAQQNLVQQLEDLIDEQKWAEAQHAADEITSQERIAHRRLDAVSDLRSELASAISQAHQQTLPALERRVRIVRDALNAEDTTRRSRLDLVEQQLNEAKALLRQTPTDAYAVINGLGQAEILLRAIEHT